MIRNSARGSRLTSSGSSDHKWDWPAAEVEFKRALELNPQYANAHHWYGDYLSIQGRHDEALVEAKRALELDSLNLMIGTWVGLRYYLARKYDGAIEQSRNTVDLDPNFAAAHLILGESYVQQGKHKEKVSMSCRKPPICPEIAHFTWPKSE